MPSGIDQSWGFASPSAARAAGVEVVSMYLSTDPSKNVTAADVRAYHPAGIALLINWEAQAGAPLNGAVQGKVDAVEAVRQLRALFEAVGYKPANRLTIYFSCDRDVSAAQIAGPVAAYYRAARDVCHTAGFGVGVYGEADVVQYLAANRITDAEWQTYAWSGGRLEPAADFYQYQNGQTLGGASVDFDRIIHADQLGAWWPPASARNNATPTGDAPVTPAEIAAIADAVYAKLLRTDGQLDAPDAAVSKNKFWTFSSHVEYVSTRVRTIATGTAAILTRVAALQRSVDALSAKVDAGQVGAVKVTQTSVPVTGTLTIGGGE